MSTQVRVIGSITTLLVKLPDGSIATMPAEKPLPAGSVIDIPEPMAIMPYPDALEIAREADEGVKTPKPPVGQVFLDSHGSRSAL